MSASHDISSVPVIDFEPFEPGGRWRDHVATQIDWAAGEFGFFYIVGHGVEQGNIERLERLTRTNLDEGEISVLEGGHSGPGCMPELPGLREAILDYVTEMTSLSHHLMSAVGRGLRLGDHYFFDNYTANARRSLRISKSQPQAEAPWGTVDRTGSGLLTVLSQSPGAAMQIRHANSWIEVPHVQGSFVIGVGDLLERLTAGRYSAAPYRVRSQPGPEPHITLSFCLDPVTDAVTSSDPMRVPRSREAEALRR